MRSALALALALACAPPRSAPPPTPAHTAGAPAPAPAGAPELPPELAPLASSWGGVDPQRAASSPIWLLTRYAPSTYPCRPGPDGTLDMLQQDRFQIDRVLRGEAAARGVDLDLYAMKGPSYPRSFVEGRRYVLFLRPGPEAQTWLADPEDLGSMHRRMGADDVLAALDLDASPAELAAESTLATRTGTRQGLRWTPEVWVAARGAPALDAEHQRRLAAFLSAEILALGTPLAELRAWLGAPDDQHVWSGGARREQYLLSRPAYDTPREGGLYGDLDLEYGPDLRLRAASLKYLRWRIEPTLRASTALTPEEHARLGLPHFEKTRGPASRGP